jgi:hypothetical protein
MTTAFYFHTTIELILIAAAILSIIYDKKLLIFERFLKIKIKEVIRRK